MQNPWIKFTWGFIPLVQKKRQNRDYTENMDDEENAVDS